MRHLKKGRKLNRTTSHRKAMLGNLAVSILQYHRVETQHEKALEVRGVVDRLITYGKRGDLHARRMAARLVHHPPIIKKLFQEIAPKFSDRNGGYTRVLKKGFRRGDNAPVSIIELVGIAQEEKVGKKGAAKKPADKKAPVSKEAEKKTADKKPEEKKPEKKPEKKAEKEAVKKSEKKKEK